MQRRRVVVTGIGIISPLGNTRQESWAGAKEGRSGVGQITRFDASAFATHFAAEVKGFSPDPFIEFKEQKKQDLFSQYAVAGAHEALTDAKLLGDAGFKIRKVTPVDQFRHSPHVELVAELAR